MFGSDKGEGGNMEHDDVVNGERSGSNGLDEGELRGESKGMESELALEKVNARGVGAMSLISGFFASPKRCGCIV